MPHQIAEEIIEFLKDNQRVVLIRDMPIMGLQLPFEFCISHDLNALKIVNKLWEIKDKKGLLSVLNLVKQRILNADKIDLSHIEENRTVYLILGEGINSNNPSGSQL